MAADIERERWAVVSRELLQCINGHPDRFLLQQIAGKRVLAVPGTRRQENGRTSVEVIRKGEKPIRIRISTKYLNFISPAGLQGGTGTRLG